MSNKSNNISLTEYLQSDIKLSEMQRFAFSKSFSNEKPRTFEEWQKFFENK